ncbi:MAG: FAD-binding protein [Muribaculaceae bacterium]|nr:FAD-binding protein [Muribaculaceae bacterium]
MSIELQLRVEPQVAYESARLMKHICSTLKVAPETITEYRIVKRSIDARQRRVMVNLTVKVFIGENAPDNLMYVPPVYRDVDASARQAIVVGAGPAGLFCALRLLELGIRPIVLERGKDVDERRKDMARIARENVVDPDSNYCFGEGGAGAYSDGKLYTRSKKRGSVEKILGVFHAHGASDDILIDAHPHIGTDRLPEVIKSMRQTILRHGGLVEFGTRVERLTVCDGCVTGAMDNRGRVYEGPVVLATGHSARDVYQMLLDAGIKIEAKGIAVGVRLEHPQNLIDCIQYHSPQGRGRYLPAAEYSMLTRVGGRGVYSFCMCPGGFIIPAASGPGQQVVNGMSPSNRGTRWANSGMVVEVLPEDLTEFEEFGELKVMKFQEAIEKSFYEESGRTHNAPAQRMDDFVNRRPSKDLPPTSYAPGIHPARIDRLLPERISSRLIEGFREFGRKSRGFLTNDAVLIGAETRTSAPVRVPRDAESLQHVEIAGLFPCGEGAGYAGGIVSAAIDGERCADAVASYLAENKE